MKNFKQDGNNISFVAGTGGVLSGKGVLSGNIFGVSVGDVAEAATGIMSTVGCFELPKLSTDTIALHQLVFWDSTNLRVTEVSLNNYPIGVALAVAGNGVATVVVRLNGVSTVAAAA